MADNQPTTATPEEWRPVAGYEDKYSVSNHGRVKSLPREVWNGRVYATRSGRIMRTSNAGHYPKVVLRDGTSGKKVYVHDLVLNHFVGPRPSPDHYSRHLDDNPKNNHISNLSWGTPSENSHDKVRNGNDHHAKRTHCIKGHEFTPDNIKRDPRYPGTRYCIACGKMSLDESRHWLKDGPVNPKSHCKRGHQMVEKNLVKSYLPRRACLACARGRSYATHHGIMDKLQEVSDSYYEKIMAA